MPTDREKIAETIERLYGACVELADENGLPERTAAGLSEVALGFRVRNATYRTLVDYSAGVEISELTATRDLQAMVRAKLLEPKGETRGRYYVSADAVTDLRDAIRAARPPREDYDPFTVAEQNLQLSLDT